LTRVFGINLKPLIEGGETWKFIVTLVTVAIPALFFDVQTARRDVIRYWDRLMASACFGKLLVLYDVAFSIADRLDPSRRSHRAWITTLGHGAPTMSMVRSQLMICQYCSFSLHVFSRIWILTRRSLAMRLGKKRASAQDEEDIRKPRFWSGYWTSE
jgi:hypothetical protein